VPIKTPRATRAEAAAKEGEKRGGGAALPKRVNPTRRYQRIDTRSSTAGPLLKFNCNNAKEQEVPVRRNPPGILNHLTDNFGAKKPEALHAADGTEIAIIGMAGRFPGAANIDCFWRNLCEGVESISFYSDAQLEAAGVPASRFQAPGYVRAAAMIDGADLFDAEFFGFNPREAELMDPQHRVLLETAWEALENAGYDSSRFEGSIGVFAGATINTYLLLNIMSNPHLTQSLEDVQINVANGGDFLTTRLSYKLDLKGPSHLVQSACSTSLVAVHLACQNLLNDEIDMALAGGVSINEKLRLGYRYSEGGMLSPDGHCRAFDAKAQGTIFGSGAAIVVLKRLESALADRDHIYAIIRGSAVNNDGSLKVGYTAPSVGGQAAVITEALANAGVGSQTIGYVETHGTGTPLGDPVEIQALTKAFNAPAGAKGSCAIGSVKTNIGHLDAAAGVTGLIKTALALKHKVLPPSLHFETPNPQINFGETPFYVNSRLNKWEPSAFPRRAGVSAFGVGGTNAHVILEEPPVEEEHPRDQSRHTLILLSAKSGEALDCASVKLASHIGNQDRGDLRDIAYTLAVGRRHFAHRRAVLFEDLDSGLRQLTGLPADSDPAAQRGSKEKGAAFAFPGQGSQHVEMARELYDLEPRFRNQIDRHSEFLRDALGRDPREILYPKPGYREAAAADLASTFFTQPLLFLVEYALASTFVEWGVTPSAMIGHSLGEYVAACVANVMTCEQALSLIVSRAKLMQGLEPGAMLSVALSEEEAVHLLDQEVALAAVNSPSQCVLSGTKEAIERIESLIIKEGIACRRLRTLHAFHSSMMDPMLKEFLDQVKQVDLNKPQIPYISNLTGTWVEDSQATDPEYWAAHLRQTVRFSAGLRALFDQPGRVVLELGPGDALSKLISRQLSEYDGAVFPSLRGRDDRPDALASALDALGRLWQAGVNVEWRRFYSTESRRRVPLPSYPFSRKRFWIEPASTPVSTEPGHNLKRPIDDWFYIPSWTLSLSAPSAQRDRSGSWIILNDGEGLGDAVAAALISRGQPAVAVGSSDRFSRESDVSFTINPEHEPDYDSLFEEVGRHSSVSGILHLWSLSGHSLEFDREAERGFYSLLRLSRALDRTMPEESIRVLVVSNNSCGIVFDEKVQPEKSAAIGACTVIAQEYPNLKCRAIDVALPAGHSRRELLVGQLLEEFDHEGNDPAVAYRGNQRWVQTFEQIKIAAGQLPLREPRAQGVYLITGGLDGIGYVLSRSLAESSSARLVIVEHRDDGDRERRDPERVAISRRRNSPETDVSQRKLQAIREAGAEVLLQYADLLNATQISEVIERTIERFGRLDGLLHCASVAGRDAFATIAETDRQQTRCHFDLNVRAVLALQEALQAVEVDFCVFDSSLSSVLGGVGYAVHAAASRFLDALVCNHNKTSRVPWLTISWDAWHLEESTLQLSDVNAELRDLAIKPEEGVEVFRRILGWVRSGQVIVSTGDLRRRIDHWINSVPAHRKRRSRAAEGLSPAHPRPSLSTTYIAPTSELELEVASIWRSALGIEKIGVLDNFFELGGDSLLAVQVVAEMKRRLNTDVPVVSLYQGITIRALVEQLAAATGASDEPGREVDGDDPRSSEREGRFLRRKLYQQMQRSRKREAVG
jgi:acyl transferase domain-containing protein